MSMRTLIIVHVSVCMYSLLRLLAVGLCIASIDIYIISVRISAHVYKCKCITTQKLLLAASPAESM